MVKHLSTMRKTWVQSLGGEDSLEKEMATLSSILAWKITWTEGPGGLQPMGSQRDVTEVQFSSVTQSCPTLRPHEPQHARPPCPSQTTGVHPNPCPSSWWYHPAISSSVVPFSSCPQSLPSSKSFPISQLFTWGGQSTGVSAIASFLPKKSQGWSPSEWTG